MAHAVGPVLFVTWQDVERMVKTVASQMQKQQFDIFFGICRGGLIPMALLAEEMKVCNIVTASIRSYDDRYLPLPQPVAIRMPPKEVFRGQRVLIIDDVWDSGNTAKIAKEHVRIAGGTSKVVTLYYKPKPQTQANLLLARNGNHPDFYAEETELWVKYPWENDH